MYVRRVEDACALLGLGLECPTADVSDAITGLADARAKRFRLENIARFADSRRFIKHESVRSGFGRVGFVSYLCLLRLHSADLAIIRAFPVVRLARPRL